MEDLAGGTTPKSSHRGVLSTNVKGNAPFDKYLEPHVKFEDAFHRKMWVKTRPRTHTESRLTPPSLR